MPIFSEMKNERTEGLKIFIYGESQRGKTLWAARAAEAGYNVLFICGENNFDCLDKLSKEAQARIRLVVCKDDFDQFRFVATCGKLFRTGKLTWDDTDGKSVVSMSLADKTHNFFEIDLNKLTTNDVLVLDSWTALTRSISNRVGDDMDVDFSEGKKANDLQGFYGQAGIAADFFLSKIPTLACHVIVCGHPQVYEKTKADPGNPKKRIVEWVRTQPISTSGPAGKRIADKFKEVLYFFIKGKNEFYIDVNRYEDRDGGSRIIEPGEYKNDSLQFITIAKKSPSAGLPTNSSEMPGCVFKRGNEITAEPLKATGHLEIKVTGEVIAPNTIFGVPVLQAAQTAEKKPLTFASLMQKK